MRGDYLPQNLLRSQFEKTHTPQADCIPYLMIGAIDAVSSYLLVMVESETE